MKKTLLLSIVLFNCWASSAQQLKSVDFENGIPDNFINIDRDMNTPSRGMKALGFEVGKAWVAYKEADGNTAAYSGSWYAGDNTKSDDWMILPTISINSEYMVLSWSAKATDEEFPDGYKVLMSVVGGTEANDFSVVLMNVNAENTVWTNHEISLSDYVGCDVTIAFVNQSDNCKFLAVDNISVAVPAQPYTLVITTPDAVAPGDSVCMEGYVRNDNYVALNGYKLTLSYQDNDYLIDNSDTILSHGDSVMFKFPIMMSAALDETKDYSLRVEANGNTDNYARSISCFARRIVIEEGTGTWCGYCPRGRVGMSNLANVYGEVFSEIDVHYTDPMAVIPYVTRMASFFTSLPNCVLNRDKETLGDPYNDIMRIYNTAIHKGTTAKVSLYAVIKDSIISASTNLEFAKSLDDMNCAVAWVLTEDSVTGYPQTNYFANTQPMGGFENMPDYILDYVHRHVARMAYPSVDGEPLEGILPRRTEMSLERTMKIPSNVANSDNLSLIAMVINRQNGEVLNVAETKVISSNMSAIDDICDDAVACDVKRMGNHVIVNLAANTKDSYIIYAFSANGALINKASSISGTTSMIVPDGMVILHVTNNHKTKTYKLF